MPTITKQQFLKDVAHEVRMLKKHATEDEIAKLNIDDLNPRKEKNCIYGLATGHCRSPRAIELIRRCCQRILHTDGQMDTIYKKTFADVKGYINGSNPNLISPNNYKYLSSIEGYIVLKNAKNENIIKYLKGETKTLTL
jgi:hypothetical protein